MNDDAPGWYGKLPMLGDFASRRLPQPFIDRCDDWLSRGIETSRQQLGGDWLNTYLTGPLWRFAWGPGVVDGQWWFGVLMPSVDKVGRYFPLVVAWPSSAAPDDSRSLLALERLYAQMSDSALATLRPRATLDDFESALGAALPESPWGCAASVRALPGRQRCDVSDEQSLLQWALTLASSEAAQRLAGHSLWWPSSASAGRHSLSLAHGLPPAEHFLELFQGSW